MEFLSYQQPLARRLIAHYLMFGLASIVVLSISWVFSGHSSLREETKLTIKVNEIRSQLIADYERNSGAGTKTLIHLLGSEDWVAYAGLVHPKGHFVAHSNPSRIGQKADQRFTDVEGDTLMERHVLWRNGKQQREFWAALESGTQNFGTLQIGVVDLTEVSTLAPLSAWMPFIILGPVVILGIGAFFLRGTARANAAIENQLCAVSSIDSVEKLDLHPLNEPGPAALGWNRLIERSHRSRSNTLLEAKLTHSLDGLHQKRFERILNSLSDGVAVTDKDGCVTYANRTFAILLQQAADVAKLRGLQIQTLLPASGSLQIASEQDLRPAVFEVLKGEALADGVLRVGRSPLLGDGNSALQQVWTIRDITQQKLADEMRNQFVYAATHELRTPLANIKAYAETLALNEIADPDQQKQFLNTINSEATRLARFVEDLLDVSQMEAGSMSLVKTDVDVGRLLTEAAEKVRPQMAQKRIDFDIQLPVKLPKVSLDKDKFLGAVINLLGNAAKYTPDEGRVTFKVVAAPKLIEISVEDTGIGISAEEVPKLFMKFFRSSDCRVRDIPGSGLGLSFAQEVARLHGGKLVVHSELNKGSQFTLTVATD